LLFAAPSVTKNSKKRSRPVFNPRQMSVFKRASISKRGIFSSFKRQTSNTSQATNGTRKSAATMSIIEEEHSDGNNTLPKQ